MFLSFVYVNIIFALAITFKHIGKAVAVLLVILQIPGSSGTYPIEMYRTYQNQAQYQKPMDALAEKIRELTEQGLAAAVYTQLTDVEEESNGILTYDRKVCKWEPQEAKDFCPKE